MTVLAARARPVFVLSPAGFAPAASTGPFDVGGAGAYSGAAGRAAVRAAFPCSASVDRSTPAAPQHTKGQRTPATGSALALDKKGA